MNAVFDHAVHIILQLAAFRRCVGGGIEKGAKANSVGADVAGRNPGGVQRFKRQQSRGRFSLGAGNTDDGKRTGGMSEKCVGQQSQRFSRAVHRDDNRIVGQKKRFFRNKATTAFIINLFRIVVPIKGRAGDADKQIVRFDSAGVPLHRLNFLRIGLQRLLKLRRHGEAGLADKIK